MEFTFLESTVIYDDAWQCTSGSHLCFVRTCLQLSCFFRIPAGLLNQFNYCRLPSNRRTLPFKCHPIVCPNNELATGRSDFLYSVLMKK